jgi:flagellar hook-length control protein FliK
MANTRTANAEIRLTPAELGPLRVQLSVDDGVATVTFHSSQAATREAIEQALPRLRDLLADNGLSLGQANVSEQDPRDGSGETHPDHKPAGVAEEGSEAGRDEHDAATPTASRERLSRSLVDTFV